MSVARQPSRNRQLQPPHAVAAAAVGAPPQDPALPVPVAAHAAVAPVAVLPEDDEQRNRAASAPGRDYLHQPTILRDTDSKYKKENIQVVPEFRAEQSKRIAKVALDYYNKKKKIKFELLDVRPVKFRAY